MMHLLFGMRLLCMVSLAASLSVDAQDMAADHDKHPGAVLHLDIQLWL
jgi:hypothetical protein